MNGKKKSYISVFLVLLLYSFSFAALGKNPLPIDERNDIHTLNQEALLYKNTKAGIQHLNKVLQAPDSSFVLNKIFQEINYGFYQPQGWCKFSVKNTGDYNQWILKIHQARVDTVQLYLQRENGAIEKFPITGHFQSIKERPFYSLHFAFPINVKQNETITFYLYTERQFGRHSIIISLEKRNYFENYQQLFMSFISFIEGMILLAALVGLVLFFFISDKLYLYYSIYCLSFFVLVLADSGFLHAFFSNEKYQFIINTFTTIFYYWIVGWHLLLIVALLNLKAYRHQWFYWLGLITGILFCLVAVVLLFIPIHSVLRWWLGFYSYFIVFYMDVYLIIALSIGIINKERGVYFYLTGFLVTILAATILMIADLQLVDGVNQNTDFYFFVPLVEIIFMVLGLGIHFSYNMKEKFRAQMALNKTQSQIITVQEDERKRIAQDLHDYIGNSLAAIKNMIIQKRDSTLIEAEMDSIIEDVRSISHDLMPVDFKEHHLTSIVKLTVSKFKNHPNIQFEYDFSGEVVKIEPVKELVIYRIINELINNVIKHSNASSALIQLIYQEEGLVVMVEDDGIGMNKTISKKSSGLGIKSMQLRADYINAKLNFESDHKGTLVILEIPYEKTEAN